MEYTPVATRTRSKTLLEHNEETKKRCRVASASRIRKVMRYNQASVSSVGECSKRSKSFNWVADDEGGRGGVDMCECGSEDVDDVSGRENDEDDSSAEEDDTSDESVSSTEEESSEDESDAETDSSSSEDSVEEENEEETEKERTEESVDVGLKRKRNYEDDQFCSCSLDFDDRSEEMSERETTDVRSEQVKKEEILEDFTNGEMNADGASVHSFSGDAIVAKSARLKQEEAIFAEVRTGCDRSEYYKVDRMWKKEQSDGLDSKENIIGNVHNQCENTEGDGFVTKKKTRRQKKVPNVEFKPPNVEGLPQRFSFAEKPPIPEKSNHDIELEDLLAEYNFAMALDNASTDSEAEENKFSRANDTGKDDNAETYSGSRPDASKKKAGVKTVTNKKGTRASKECIAFSILLDSIYEKEEESLEHFTQSWKKSLKRETPKDEAPRDSTLPLFFTFDHHPPSPPPEKSEFEVEIDNLFDEYNFVSMSGEIGSTDFEANLTAHVRAKFTTRSTVSTTSTATSSTSTTTSISDLTSSATKVDEKDSLPPGEEVNQHFLCSKGKHDLVLNEEIGLICRFCPHVHQEIRYVLPDFASNPYGKSGNKFSEENSRPILDDLQCNDHNDCFHSHTEGTVWDLIPGVESDMYPHQRDGFEFIWRHLSGGTELEKLVDLSDYPGDGCIISHAPGTGKTRLTIIFIQSYMKFNPSCRPLIIAPRTMLLTWEEEFKKWGYDTPFHNLNNPDFTGKEDEAARNLVKDGKRSEMTNLIRAVKLKSWVKTRSILGISYALFEQICGVHNKSGRHVLSPRRVEEAEQMSRVLLEFPGLVVFDEGHNPRNEQSYSWNTLQKLKTRRRILLSGTPFQNSFEELKNTVELVRPHSTTNLTRLGGFDRKQWPSYQMRGGKQNVRKGDYADDVNSKRARDVRDMISPFVHVYKGTILQDKLPGLRSAVVVLRPTALQQRYLDRIQKMTTFQGFKYEVTEAKITIHPSLLLNEERSMLFEKSEYSGDWESLKDLKLVPGCGVKARFAVELIRLCQATNERVLVFSQWVDPLYLIRDLLVSQFRWAGDEIIYMDGSCDAKQRQSSMSNFNDLSSKAKVLLASTRGCNEGISLVGASRVVLLDVAWNPSVERQAISRAYRIGQKKVVYVYHLLMAGTREEGKYSCQVEKHRLSELVFSCSEKEAAKRIPAAVAEDKVLEEMVQHQKLKHIFRQIVLLDEASYLAEEF